MTLELGLSATNQTDLNNDWQNRVKLYLETSPTNLTTTRRLQTQTQLTIDSFVLSSNSIVMKTTAVAASAMTADDYFLVQFSDNLYSPNDVMYTLKVNYEVTSEPWKLRTYYDLNLPLNNVILVPFLVIAAIILLFRIKYIYYGWLEYVNCIQLMGLTYYSIYPYSISLDLYSFLIGANYANFTFIYNVPL